MTVAHHYLSAVLGNRIQVEARDVTSIGTFDVFMPVVVFQVETGTT